MTVWFDWPDLPRSLSPALAGTHTAQQTAPSVVTVGVFDGFHRGHQELLSTAVREGRTRGLPTTLVTFDPHPLTVLCPDRAPRLLLPVSARIQHALDLGADTVVVLPFTEETASMSAEDFVDAGLVGRLGMRHLVVGDNFRCGADGRGDLDFLRHRGARHGYDVMAVPLVHQAGITCSSTEVRKRIASGDLHTVTALLGRTDPRILVPRVRPARQR